MSGRPTGAWRGNQVKERTSTGGQGRAPMWRGSEGQPGLGSEPLTVHRGPDIGHKPLPSPSGLQGPCPAAGLLGPRPVFPISVSLLPECPKTSGPQEQFASSPLCPNPTLYLYCSPQARNLFLLEVPTPLLLTSRPVQSPCDHGRSFSLSPLWSCPRSNHGHFLGRDSQQCDS